MGFLNPWLLLAMGGVAVPILAHLLNRFRHREIQWGAMELLRRAIVVRSRRIQIEDLILLLLRCLAVILLALALARPTLTLAGGGWFGRPDVAVLVALDGSYSMEHKPGMETRFGKAVAETRQIFQTLDEGTPLTLVMMGDRPRILLRNVAYDEAKIDRVLDKLKPLPEGINVERSLEQTAALLGELKAPRREVYIVSDAQARTWSEVSDLASVFMIPTPATGSENLAITDLAAASGQPRQGASARYVAEVTNAGQLPVSSVPVTLRLDGQPVDRTVIPRLEPGATRRVPLFLQYDQSGLARLEASLPTDPLPTDNVRYAVADVRDRIRVLLVDGEPSERPFRGETDFLLKSLLPKGDAVGSLKVDRVSWAAIATKSLDDFDVVVLANVADLHEDQVDRLGAFVRGGGGLLITLGANVSGRLANARLGAGESALLPAELGDRRQYPRTGPDSGDGWRIEPAGDHRLSRILQAVPAPLLAEARIEELFEVQPKRRSQVVLRLAANGLPLLIERSVGHGKVLLLTTTADRAWGNLAIHPIFPMLVHESVGYLTGASRQREFIVGEPLTVRLPARLAGRKAMFSDPEGRDYSVNVNPAEGEGLIELDEPTEPGIHYLTTADGGVKRALAVNVDPGESRVGALDREGLLTGLKGMPLRVPETREDLAEQVRRLRVGRELWRIFMIAGLAALLVEALLAYLFSRRARVREGADVESVGRPTAARASAAA